MIPEVPEKLQYRIAKLGGRTDDGQPLFRVMRSCDRMAWVGGPWKKHDASGNITGECIEVKLVPAYAHVTDRYVFEAWFPPEWYGTPESWERDTHLMFNGIKVETQGPYPRHGDYELVKVLETPERKLFVPLTEAICVALVETAVRNKGLSVKARIAVAQENREREERARIAKQIAMIENISKPKEFAQPHVVMPSDYEVRKYMN